MSVQLGQPRNSLAFVVMEVYRAQPLLQSDPPETVVYFTELRI